MSVIGKGSSSLRKKDVAEQKSIALGLKKMVFAHRANAGEAGINLTALVTPAEMSAYGFVNPSVGELSRTNILQLKNNLKIVSSLSGLLMPYMSYTVNSSTYIAFNGFTAAADEVFVCYLDEAPTTSLSVVDGEPIVVSGILAAGQTDFNIGTPITINENPTSQIGAVMAFADRGLQYRKVGNNASGDGDYIEVPVAGGLGSLLRFDASGVDRFITVVSNGVVAERPDGSMMAVIERVQGQVDQMIPTLAAVAGVPETTFQTSPNSVDLKQFGDLVLQHNTDIAEASTEIDALQDQVPTGAANARYFRTTSISLPDNTVSQVLDFNVQDYDQGSLVTTGANWKYTCQFDGYLSIKGALRVDFPVSSGVRLACFVYLLDSVGNTLQIINTDDRNQVTSAGYGGAVIGRFDCDMKVSIGNQIQFRVLQGSGAARNTSALSNVNWVSFTKVIT